jgi:plasmid stability protein
MASITFMAWTMPSKRSCGNGAARNCRSIEEEARKILEIEVAANAQPGNLGDAIRARFEPLGGFELPEFPGRKDLGREPPSFG